jgi:methionine-rich copper-binding protein CopC
MLKRVLVGIAALGLMSASPAFAHAALKLSAPKSGATVAAPQNLSLTFSEKVRLTAVKLTSGGKDISVKTDRAAPAAETFSLPLSALAPGNYQVRWSALGDDGHPVNGTFTFVVASSAG